MDTYLPLDFAALLEQATNRITTEGRIKCVLIAYEKALEDPKFVCPSHLHAAIEALRRV